MDLCVIFFFLLDLQVMLDSGESVLAPESFSGPPPQGRPARACFMIWSQPVLRSGQRSPLKIG